MVNATIKGIEYYLPINILNNDELSKLSPDWPADKIFRKTGIAQRHIASENQCASDLAYFAAEKLFNSGICQPEEIDFILFCTQSPDYILPTSACVLQERLNLSENCGALDFSLGCSGYIYGLGLAKGLIETHQAQNVLLLTADTYTKHLNPKDISTRSIFGDAGSATLISSENNTVFNITTPIFGTDGKGAENLIIKESGQRKSQQPYLSSPQLYMNGPEIFNFTLSKVPLLVEKLLNKFNLKIENMDYFIFHQANKFMLEHLRDKINIPPDKFHIQLTDIGNTVSSSIPIALWQAFKQGKVNDKSNIMLIGFGVGYSWAGVLVSPFVKQHWV